MPKELRDFIAVAGARARWRKADILDASAWTPAMREYLSKREEYKRDHGVMLTFFGEP